MAKAELFLMKIKKPKRHAIIVQILIKNSYSAVRYLLVLPVRHSAVHMIKPFI